MALEAFLVLGLCQAFDSHSGWLVLAPGDFWDRRGKELEGTLEQSEVWAASNKSKRSQSQQAQPLILRICQNLLEDV